MLALALHPVIPVRTPRAGRPTVLYGYNLRLVEGQLLTNDDPLLSAFASSVEPIGDGVVDLDALQAESFDPGTGVSLVREGVDDDGDEIVSVWDAGDLRRAGVVPYSTAARIAAS